MEKYKTVILCGGKGTRLSEETVSIPKPMVEIGGMPILEHIMRIYDHYECNHFILCAGYKQEIIKQYFINYNTNNSDIRVDLNSGLIYPLEVNQKWKDTKLYIIDTGLDTETGDRIKQIKNNILEDFFCLTYGDGVSNVDIKKLIEFHKSHGKVATLTAVKDPGKYGMIGIDGDKVTSYREKPTQEGFINGGFFVLNRNFFDYLVPGDLTKTLEVLVDQGELMCYKHNDFWKCMDTVNDKNVLEELWNKTPFWRKW